MRKLFQFAVLAALAGCGGARPLDGPPAPEAQPAPERQAYVIPSDASLVVVIAEAVGSPEEDRPSYTKVFLGGKEAGQTEAGPRSQEKRWGLALPPGNHLLRLEKWEENPAGSGQWAPLPADWQPRERFVLVKDGQRSVVSLKFVDGARRHDYKIERVPLP